MWGSQVYASVYDRSVSRARNDYGKSTGIRLGNDMHQSTRRSTEAIRGFAEFPRFRGSPGEARLLRVLDDRWWETNVERID